MNILLTEKRLKNHVLKFYKKTNKQLNTNMYVCIYVRACVRAYVCVRFTEDFKTEISCTNLLCPYHFIYSIKG